MDAVLRNIWVHICCCCRLPANTIQPVNTGGSIQRLLKMNIITLHNSVQVHVKFRVQKKVHIFHFLYIFKTNGTELIDESADVCLQFSGLWKSTQFLLEFVLHLLSLVYILWVHSSLLWPTTAHFPHVGIRTLQCLIVYPHSRHLRYDIGFEKYSYTFVRACSPTMSIEPGCCCP